MITADREIRWYRRQIRVRPDVKDQIHANQYVEQEMAMEQPVSRVIRAEAEDDVAIVGNGDGVLGRWQVELSVQKTSLIEIEGVLQIDLLHIPIGRTADTNHVECVSVQVEGMRQIRLLYFVYENHLDDRIMRNINLMRAHAVGAAISWSIITVAELFRWDVIDLRDWRRRRERE